MPNVLINYLGQECESKDEGQTVIAAKRLMPDRCLVLATADGMLWDPVEDPSGPRKKDGERSGPKYRFINCSPGCLQAYAAYLRHRNRADLLIAQRRFTSP